MQFLVYNLNSHPTINMKVYLEQDENLK